MKDKEKEKEKVNETNFSGRWCSVYQSVLDCQTPGKINPLGHNELEKNRHLHHLTKCRSRRLEIFCDDISSCDYGDDGGDDDDSVDDICSSQNLWICKFCGFLKNTLDTIVHSKIKFVRKYRTLIHILKKTAARKLERLEEKRILIEFYGKEMVAVAVQVASRLHRSERLRIRMGSI
uniref:SBP-type domain-containing protein n=1 Tax=Romanomermis culicivorax TaxID=13658 RepID=A0A915JU41_ROMCU